MPRLRFVLALALPLLMVAVQASPAHALSCIQQSTEQQVEQADAVLIGSVQSFE